MIFRWVKQEWLDWWYTATTGEKAADIITFISLIVIGLALLFARQPK